MSLWERKTWMKEFVKKEWAGKRKKKEEWKECVRKREKGMCPNFFSYVSSPRKLILRMEPLIPCWMIDRWEQIVNHHEIGLKVAVHFEQIHSVIQDLEVKQWRNHQWLLLLSTTWLLEVDHLVVVKIRSLVRWFFRVSDRWFFRVFWFVDLLIDSLFPWLWWSREWKGEKNSERGRKRGREGEEGTDEKSQEGKKKISFMNAIIALRNSHNQRSHVLFFFSLPLCLFLFWFLLSSLHWFN